MGENAFGAVIFATIVTCALTVVALVWIITDWRWAAVALAAGALVVWLMTLQVADGG